MIRWNRLSLVTIFLLAATTAPVGAAAQTVDYVVRGTVVASLSNGTVNIPTSTPFLSLLGSSFEIQAEVDPTVTREFALGFNPEGPNTFHYGGSFSFAVGGFSGVGADHTQLIGLQNDMPRSSVTRLDSFTLSATSSISANIPTTMPSEPFRSGP